MFQPFFECAQHPKAGRNTQQPGILSPKHRGIGMAAIPKSICVVFCCEVVSKLFGAKNKNRHKGFKIVFFEATNNFEGKNMRHRI